jgi:hypothetical protein
MRKLVAAVAAFLMLANPVLATTNFPGAVDASGLFGTAVHGLPVQHTTINNLRDALIAVETKVGKNGDSGTSTLDWLLKNSASADPGHTHTGASLTALNASTLTTGTVPDARLAANIARLDAANTWALLQSFSSGISVTGTATATLFSGSGASLTNIPETAITDGALLARVADNETITGNWSFVGTLTADGANITNIPETAITDGVLLARVADNESITGTWSFVGNIAKIRNVSYVWPGSNSVGCLNNDGSGNLSWASCGAGATSPAGSPGAVQFNSGGLFAADTTNFFWDNSAKRLGIGTNTPGVSLDVFGGNIRTNNQFVSTVSTGTAPLIVASTTVVANLNADLLDGISSAAFELVANKDAPSGYAGLTAGTKLQLTEMQEVMATGDLSDVTGTTGSGSTLVFNTSPTFVTSIIVPLVTETAGTPVAMSASAVAGTSPLQFTADTTSGTSATKQFLFQMANTGSPNVNPLRGVYIAEPSNSFTGVQFNLYVEDATKASGAKWSIYSAGDIGADKDITLGGAGGGSGGGHGGRVQVNNQFWGSGAGTSTDRLFYTIHHASQSGDIWRDETSSGFARLLIAVNTFTGTAQEALVGIGNAIDPDSDHAQLDVKGPQPPSVSGNGTAALVNALFVGGKGGNTSGTTGQTAGTGGAWSITLGDGGDAPSGSTNGNGGSFLFQAGFRGGGAGATGSNGSFGVIAGGGVVNNPIFMRAESNSTTAFEIQRESGVADFRVDTTNEIVYAKDFFPLSDASYNLGSASKQWQELFLKGVEIRPSTTTTNNATITTLDTIATASGHNYTVHANVTARQTGGSPGSVGDAGGFECTATYRNVSGSLTEVGESCPIEHRDDVSWVVNFDPSGTDILVEVTGSGTKNITWVGSVEVRTN